MYLGNPAALIYKTAAFTGPILLTFLCSTIALVLSSIVELSASHRISRRLLRNEKLRERKRCSY
jgi:hypothetical protein